MTTQNENSSSDQSGQMDDTPPFFKRWSDIYRLVLIILFSLIGMFYLFSIGFK